jgi:triosephosphate isomerase
MPIMKKLVVANWKMTPQAEKKAREVFIRLLRVSGKSKTVKLVVCPPFVWLPVLKRAQARAGSKIVLGAQDVFWENKGSFTGEISVQMLRDLGVKYAIVGHSERRAYLNETDWMINKKIKNALKNKLSVIFCVGERERDEGGEYLKFVKKQIIGGLFRISRSDLKKLIIAYEPVWAISSSKSSNMRPRRYPRGTCISQADRPEDFLEMSIFIKRVLFSKFGREVSQGTPILYGGSVNPSNAREFLEKGGADGVLVGRASWQPEIFIELLNSIN